MRGTWAYGLTLKRLVGMRMRTTRETRNTMVKIPRGTIVTLRLTSRWDKLRVEGPKCAHCGLSPLMGGLNVYDLEPVPE